MMTNMLDIPIISRGRIIMPGEDAVVFRGRGGSLVGVQRMVPLSGGDPMQIFQDMHTLPAGMPHDGIEPMRRNVRWVIDHRAPLAQTSLDIAAE